MQAGVFSDAGGLLGFYAELPESHCSSGCNIQRVDVVRHGYADNMICLGDCFVGKSVSLGAHYYCQTRFGGELRTVEGYGVVGQSHGGSGETEVVEVDRKSVV